MKRKLGHILIAAGILLASGLSIQGFQHWRSSLTDRAAHETGYHCPMHPTFTSDKPGSCPICNMTLVPNEPQQAAEGSATMAEAEAAEIPKGKPLYYRNSMHPEMTSPTPKKDEMGMEYVAVYAEESSTSSVPGQGSMVLSADQRQMIGMKSEAVQKRDLSDIVRATGSVAYDPDLYHAISEYSEAAKARDALKESPYPDVLQRSDALVQASNLRLRQMGLSEVQIEAITKTTQTPTNLLFSGPGGTVWVYAQIYEYEIALVIPGQRATITTPAYPGRKFTGIVKALDPILSPETRSLKARIEVPNPEGLLKLEMYVDAAIKVDMGKKLALPSSALVDTGERKIVYIDVGNGRIEPREVQVGREAEGYIEVLSGVKEGEHVVTSANFLIDSESKLKGIAPNTGKKKQDEPKH